MPLQNRVKPFGEIVAVTECGTLMGNRGILHDDTGHLVRSLQVRRWIACRTAFRGCRRQLMQPHSYTELFFLDEATAFAAGHRPCAACWHADCQRFKAAWTVGVGASNGADGMDAILHADRLEGRGAQQRKRTYREQFASTLRSTQLLCIIQRLIGRLHRPPDSSHLCGCSIGPGKGSMV